MFDTEGFNRRLRSVKEAAKELANIPGALRDRALLAAADELEKSSQQIIAANELDLASAVSAGMNAGLQDRLRLDTARVAALAAAVREIVQLQDPIGEVLSGRTLADGMLLQQVRVPFGVIGAIYEARPNVTVDIAALALKSANAVVLRGGSAAVNTNTELLAALHRALLATGINPSVVQSIDDSGRAGVKELMRARAYVDVLIPRGSQELIAAVTENATVPVIETGAGVVHIYVDKSANIETALKIIKNAKAQRPGVCNAVDTVLVHERIAAEILPRLYETLEPCGVELIGCKKSCELVSEITEADAATWATEHLSLRLGVRIVPDLDAALAHIAAYSTGHTEAVIADDYAAVETFLQRVDAASVIANASTRFTDGGVFGFGAEVGISTQKLHARGPMGLTALTSCKWIMRGNGQIRQ